MKGDHSEQLTILLFHGVVAECHASRDPQRKHVLLDDFRSHVAWLREYATPLPLSFALQCLQRGEPLPPNAVSMTFDDGYASTANLALPVLHDHSVPVAVFLSTDFTLRHQHLWTDRVEYSVMHGSSGNLEEALRSLLPPKSKATSRQELASSVRRSLKSAPPEVVAREVSRLEEAAGVSLYECPGGCPPEYAPLDERGLHALLQSDLVEIGPHSVRHHILARLSTEEIATEVEASTAEIRGLAKSNRIDAFAYPNGGAADFDIRVIAAVQRSGNQFALTTIPRAAARTSPVYEMPRFPISGAPPCASLPSQIDRAHARYREPSLHTRVRAGARRWWRRDHA